MRIGIDVMGGDHAPDAIIRGCVDALDLLADDDTLVLVGNRDDIEELLGDAGVSDARLEVVHAPDVIDMHETPVEAVRTKTDSSMVVMSRMGSVKAGDAQCDAVLSAGNTGACVSAATMNMKRLRGVHRPGIAVTMPLFSGPVVLCDAGANPQPRPQHLWQYALMAEVFANRALGIEEPRVAVMNIGSEEAKGTGLVKATSDMLRRTPGINYVGYIEGREFFEGAADVVVTDGFTGNTVLKVSEGFARSFFKAMAEAVFEHDAELGLALQPVMQSFFSKKDYHELGGAPLLGVNGLCMIAHGSSEARTIRSAIRTCKELVIAHVNDAIIDRLAETRHVEQPEREPA